CNNQLNPINIDEVIKEMDLSYFVICCNNQINPDLSGCCSNVVTLFSGMLSVYPASIYDALNESLEEIHQRKAEIFYTDLKQLSLEAKTSAKLEVLSIFANSTAKNHFIIEKNGCKFKYPMENLPLLYNRRLNIKAEKLKDVRELAAKYVPAEHLWFYEQFEETNDTSVLSDYEY
ncbi:NAD-dependent protein deacetylase Sir2B-like, partial [Aphis craccivora]